MRHSVSSQKQNRSASEPPPRATTMTSTAPVAARSCSGGGDPRRGVAILDRRERPHEAALPAAAPQAGEDVVAGLAALAGDDADRARQRRARQPLLRREQALGVERLAQPVELGEQVALAGDAQRRDREGERRRRRAAAGVVVQAARDDDLRAVGERALAEPQRVEVVAPHRARHRPVAVAQLEVDLRPAHAQVPDLAEELHARALAQELAQLGGIRAHAVGPRQGAAVDPRGARLRLGHRALQSRFRGAGSAGVDARRPASYRRACCTSVEGRPR